MIYGYRYLKHDIEKFDEGIKHFFQYLLDYEPKTLDRKKMFSKSFEPLIEKSRRKFDPLLKDLILEYHKLSPSNKAKVTLALKNNSDIENLCSGKGSPIKYDDFKSKFSELLKEFEEKIWDEFPHNNTIRAKCKTIKNHFDCFVDEKFQKALVCPHCGINPLKPSKGKYKDAYDHYLPKSKYPFTSMNLKNIAPICTECNKNEKGDDDILFKGNKRRVVFYLFDKKLKIGKLSMDIKPKQKYNPIKKSTKLANIDWEYDTKVNGKKDSRVDSWEDIFRTQGRYKEYMPSMEREWFDWIKNRYKESIEDGVSFSKFKKRRIDEVKKQIISEKGMMRYSYIHFLLNRPNIKKKLDLVIK